MSDAVSAKKPGRAPVRPAAPRGAETAGKSRGRSSKSPKRLVVTQGSLAGTSVPLGDQPISIGRAPDSTIVLDDDYVSHRHARIAPDAQGRWLVDDLGSTNGTYLDRQRITGPTPVANGIPIRIGKTVVELRR